MKKILIALAAPLLCTAIFGQVIKGTITGRVESIEVYAPISITVNSFAMPFRLKPDREGNFFYQSTNGKTGYYQLSLDNDYKFFFLQPHDTLILKVDMQKKQVKVSGPKNQKFLLYINLRKEIADRYDRVIDRIEGKGSLKERVEVDRQSATGHFVKNWRTMLKQDLEKLRRDMEPYKSAPYFDSTFFRNTMAALKLRIYFWHIMVANTIQSASPRYAEEARRLRKDIFTIINPSDTTFNGIDDMQNIMLLHQLLEEVIPKYKVLKDSSWNAFDLGYQYAQYLRPELQEMYFGETLIVGLYANGFTPRMEREFSQFKHHFPQSDYIVAAESMRTIRIGDAKRSARYNFLDSLPIGSLKDLAREVGGRPFLVDLWGIWCPVCKRQFYDLKKLRPELEKRNVAVVYLCFNPKTAAGGYYQEVGRFDLQGFNLLVDMESTFGKELKEAIFLGRPLAVPRYALFDGQGNLLSHDLPHPDQNERLLEEIDRLLK